MKVITGYFGEAPPLKRRVASGDGAARPDVQAAGLRVLLGVAWLRRNEGHSLGGTPLRKRHGRDCLSKASSCASCRVPSASTASAAVCFAAVALEPSRFTAHPSGVLPGDHVYLPTTKSACEALMQSWQARQPLLEARRRMSSVARGSCHRPLANDRDARSTGHGPHVLRGVIVRDVVSARDPVHLRVVQVDRASAGRLCHRPLSRSPIA